MPANHKIAIVLLSFTSILWLAASFLNPYCLVSGIQPGYQCALGWFPSPYLGQAEAYQLGGVSLLIAVLASQMRFQNWMNVLMLLSHLAIGAGLVSSLMFSNLYLSKLQMAVSVPMIIGTLMLISPFVTSDSEDIQSRNRAARLTWLFYRTLKARSRRT